MATVSTKKGLGRGLSALIPDADMAFLSRVARGEAPALSVKRRQQVRSTTDADKVIEGTSGTHSTKQTKHIEGIALETIGDEQDKPTLLPSSQSKSSSTANAGDSLEGTNVEWIVPSTIRPNPYQPRRAFNGQEMEELVASVREHGILQPILVRPYTDPSAPKDAQHSYQIIAGERRWRAAQAAEVQQIPAIVRDVADQQALELALIENVQRHDITALDAALAYRRLAQEFSLSQDAVAQRVGKSRSAVANTMRLLDLPVEVQKAIEEGALSEGHGRAILLAEGDGARRAVFRRVLRERLSVRATEELARQTLDPSSNSEEKTADQISSRDVESSKGRHATEIKRIEEALQKALKTRVGLKPRAKGGQIVLHYFSNEDLQRLLSILITGDIKS